jgi:hypothetical protein
MLDRSDLDSIGKRLRSANTFLPDPMLPERLHDLILQLLEADAGAPDSGAVSTGSLAARGRPAQARVATPPPA